MLTTEAKNTMLQTLGIASLTVHTAEPNDLNQLGSTLVSMSVPASGTVTTDGDVQVPLTVAGTITHIALRNFSNSIMATAELGSPLVGESGQNVNVGSFTISLNAVPA